MLKNTLIFFLILLAAVWGISKTWYPVKVTNGLYYPEKQGSVELIEDQSFVLPYNPNRDQQFYLLRKGTYVEVLTNDDGSFYIAPKLGLYKDVFPDKGFAVGGIYIPSVESESIYFWEYNLKFKDRSPVNPNINRALNESRDQPDRELFLNRVWYSSKGFTFFGRPMIKTGMTIDREMVVVSK